jgi:hypothetical protein
MFVLTDYYIAVIRSVVVTSAVIDITRSLWLGLRKHELDGKAHTVYPFVTTKATKP